MSALGVCNVFDMYVHFLGQHLALKFVYDHANSTLGPTADPCGFAMVIMWLFLLSSAAPLMSAVSPSCGFTYMWPRK